MKKEESFERIFNFLNSTEGALTFGKKVDEVKKYIQWCNNVIKNLEQDGSVIVGKKEIDIVWFIINSLKDYVLYRSINNIENIEAFIILLYNLNNGLYKDDKLKREIDVLDRLLKQHYTIKEALSIFRRMRNIIESYTTQTPGVMLAKHYLHSLRKKIGE